MRQVMAKKLETEALALIDGITYAQVEHWYDRAYRDLKMTVICPKSIANHTKRPAIVWLCGGGFSQMDRNVWLPQMVRLAQRGFVIASPDYRTSNAVKFPEPLKDVKSAIRYLRANAEKYCVDENRIYIMGESAGGTYAALCSVTNGKKEYEEGNYLEYSSAVQAAVVFYGLMDLKLGLTDEKGEHTGIFSFFQDRTEEGSAMMQVTEDTPPTMLLHGTEDILVPIAQSENYYKKLQEIGIRSDLLIIEGAMHGDEVFYQEEIYDRIANFLNT